MSDGVNIGDLLDVTIEKIVAGGLGLAFAPGLTVFVALAAPGDRATVRVTAVKGRVAFAEIESIIEPSPVRAEPPCKYFGVCGGCDLQQLSYDAQLEAKRGIILESLRRIGKIEPPVPVTMIAAKSPLAYRTRAAWHADTRTGALGYFRRSSHEVVDVDSCPILAPPLAGTLAEIKAEFANGTWWSELIDVEAASGSDGSVSVFYSEGIEEPREIAVSAAGAELHFDARTFFQSNAGMLEPLIDAAIGGAGGSAALDLYCGVGLFSIPLAAAFESVVGVEADAGSIAWAEKNAALAGRMNVDFVASRVDRFLKEHSGTSDLILLDPPRSGTEKGVIPMIHQLSPREISYVSCDPVMLARDLANLSGYSIVSITGIDLFPQTHHIETVVRLKRKLSAG